MENSFLVNNLTAVYDQEYALIGEIRDKNWEIFCKEEVYYEITARFWNSRATNWDLPWNSKLGQLGVSDMRRSVIIIPILPVIDQFVFLRLLEQLRFNDWFHDFAHDEAVTLREGNMLYSGGFQAVWLFTISILLLWISLYSWGYLTWLIPLHVIAHHGKEMGR